MPDEPGATQDRAIRTGQLFWLIRVRWFALSFALLLTFLLSYLRVVTVLTPVVLLLILGAFLNLFYFFCLKHEMPRGRLGEKEFCLAQIVIDLMGILALSHFTGGLVNPFIFFVAAPVSVAGAFFQPWWTYVFAFFAWGLAAVLGLFEAAGVIASHSPFLGTEAMAPPSLHAFRSALLLALGGFLFAHAYLVCTLAGVLRKREWRLAKLEHSVEAFQRGRAALEEATRAAASDAAGGIRREIKDPLGIIRARVDAVRYGLEDLESQDPSLARDVGVIASKVDQVEKAVDRILSLMSDGRSDRKPMDVGNLLRTLLSPSSELFARRAVEVSARIPSVLPLVEGSEQDLRDLFLALLGEALESLKGNPGGRLRVAARFLNRGTGRLLVRIRDNGPGVLPGVREKIRDPFFDFEEQGPGRGFAAAYAIARSHGGALRVRSRPPPGTSVTVLLPAGAGALPTGR